MGLRALVPVDSFTLEFVARTVVRVYGASVELLLLPVGPATNDLAVVLERLEALQISMRLLPTRRGEVASVSLTAAEELAPDVIALATLGYGRWRMDRCPAQELLRQSQTPVLVCNPTEFQLAQLDDPIGSILLPLDGSPLAEDAIPLAADLAQTHQADLTLLHVQAFHTNPEPTTFEDMGLLPHDRDELRALRFPARSLALLEGPRARLEETLRRTVQTEAALGDVAGEILARAASSDLIVLATNGKSGPSPWWLGTVAKRIVRSTPVAALVLRTGRSTEPVEAAIPLHTPALRGR